MGSSVLMTIGTQAITAAYAQLMTSSNNIANANTAGYSRQQVKLLPTEGQFTGSGYFGRGVTVQTVQRASNIFLTQQAASTASVSAADANRRDLLAQLDKVFGTNAGGLGSAVTQIFNAWADLSAAPADLSARQSVLADLQSFATLANTQSDQLTALQSSVGQNISNSVSDLNQMLAAVAALNQRIVDVHGNGQTPNDLLDQRDELVSRISQSLEVTTVSASDGSIGVFAVGGQNLVLGNQSNTLVASPDRYDPTRTDLSLKIGNAQAMLDWSKLGGGSITGALRFQNEDLAVARDRLGQLVGAVAGTLNRQQTFGLDLSGQTGTAVLQMDAPRALPAADNATSGGAYVASVSMTIADPNALQASEYVLANDAANPGMYTVTRRSDGKVTSNLASGSTVDGFTFSVDSPLAAGDTFLLQPVATAAGSVRLALADPRGLAAALPVTMTAAITNTGSASVNSLAINATPSAPYQAMTLKFVSGSGDWQLLDASSSVLSSGTLTAGQPITYDGITMQIAGAPANGDSFAIDRTVYPVANNGNALATDALAPSLMVAGSTATDAYAALLAEVGARSASANAAADTSASVADAAHLALSSVTGVNLDEEAARLMQYQQSYQAAAKILQTAQSVIETLIQLGGN